LNDDELLLYAALTNYSDVIWVWINLFYALFVSPSVMLRED